MSGASPAGNGGECHGPLPSGPPPPSPPCMCAACTQFQLENEQLKIVTDQLHRDIAHLQAENTALVASVEDEQQTAAMYAQRVAELQPSLDALACQRDVLTRTLGEQARGVLVSEACH